MPDQETEELFLLFCVGAEYVLRFLLFADASNGEHQELLDKKRVEFLSKSAVLHLMRFTRFFAGMNQPALFQVCDSMKNEVFL